MPTAAAGVSWPATDLGLGLVVEANAVLLLGVSGSWFLACAVDRRGLLRLSLDAVDVAVELVVMLSSVCFGVTDGSSLVAVLLGSWPVRDAGLPLSALSMRYCVSGRCRDS